MGTNLSFISYISLFTNLNEKEEFRLLNFQIAIEDLVKNVLKIQQADNSAEDLIPPITLEDEGSKEASSQPNANKKRGTLRSIKDETLNRMRYSTIINFPMRLIRSEKGKSRVFAPDSLSELAVLLKHELDLQPFQVGNHIHKRTFSGKKKRK